jgi:hypothetical protein
MLNFIKLYKLPIGIVAFFLYTVLTVFAGWQVHTYYNGYQDSLNQKVEKIVNDGISDYQRKQAQGFEDQKALLAGAATNTIIREKTILEKPIYLQKCMDQDGVDELTRYKQESALIINGKKK